MLEICTFSFIVELSLLLYLSFLFSSQFILRAYTTQFHGDEDVHVEWNTCLAPIMALSLLNFPNVINMDISGCDTLTANDFVDCIGFLRHLEIIRLDRCSQFTEYHFIKMFTQLKQLKIVSMLKCQQIPFTPMYTICCSLQNLQYIDFEPKNIKIEERDWKKLCSIFLNVTFGSNFRELSQRNW